MTAIDLALLEGMKFSCLEGCGFCCSYPAEVRECEDSFSLIQAIDPAALKKWDTDNPQFCNVFTMRQHNDIGACIYLKDDNRCDIYPIRSILCRTYPIKIFFGWRMQLYTTMACRGLIEASGSSDLLRMGEHVLSELPPAIVQQMASEANAMYAALPDILDDYISPEILQEKMIEYARDMVIDLFNLSEKCITDFESQLSSGDFMYLPTYLSQDLKWLVFRLQESHIKKMILKRNGETETIQIVDYTGIRSRTFSPAAIRHTSQYILKIARSDHFTGMIYLDAVNSEKQESLVDRGIRLLNYIAGSFLIKANFLAAISNRSEIDEELVRETIIFSDGYLATEPAYGLIL